MTDTPEEPLDLEMLMTLDPLKLRKADVTDIITYHRRIRAQREAGKGRKTAATATAEKPKSITELLNAKKPTTPVIKRRGF